VLKVTNPSKHATGSNHGPPTASMHVERPHAVRLGRPGTVDPPGSEPSVEIARIALVIAKAMRKRLVWRAATSD